MVANCSRAASRSLVKGSRFRTPEGRSGAPVRSRTSNLLIRSQPLYPIELRVRTGPETRNGPAERQDRFSGIIEARREFGLGIGPQLRKGSAR